MKEISAAEKITGVRTAVALGIFDGVHRGHMAVIGRAAEYAGRFGLAPAVCTFKTASITTKGSSYHPIYSDDTKLRLLEMAGAEYVYMPAFDEIRDLSPERFVREILLDKLCASALVCGRNFRFGKNAACDAVGLGELCRQMNIHLSVVDDVLDHGERISSSNIRDLLSRGKITSVNRLLGHDFAVCGEVVHGRQLGRQMSFPTANQLMDRNSALPAFGVYASYCEIDGTMYRGVTNIGIKPTVQDDDRPLSETHFPLFSGDLYGRDITVRLQEFLRPEKKFSSIEELKNQIASDTSRAMELPLRRND